ncbi:ADP/ATP-dependent (S)-NAD(P)H-hydrate dehydratase [Agreia sp. VKM Ac-1783]|uniref:ADP-dependent NAD(P)H-hydrate dehydratase n=1 Tax=Agreia sp. VKM Ac-1783 TaxID=1938889 RepID=UPI000A2AEF94|nr:ADP/ATP-dependent (S)-NAD(P)H-hydrate dehydratase [Agreia sp. VKM Ac-1783]SMQ68472.1 yjeF C-terminal region, hydroxyethylthiazole kinase-related [Agreia sp. VKM Ac-1783]
MTDRTTEQNTTQQDAERVTPKSLQRWPLPSGGESKSDRGSVLMVGGSPKSPGAVLLAGRAALRSGGGRLTLALAESRAAAASAALPEAGIVGLPENSSGQLGEGVVFALRSELEGSDALLIGPGLHSADEARTVLEALLPHVPSSTGLVLDAFALGVLPGLIDHIEPFAGRLVLTPNKKEASILLGRSPDDEPEDGDVDEVASRYGAVVSCFDRISDADGSSWIVTEGGPGLGVSGSGDVLAGSITGLLARGLDPIGSACWGTWAHSEAGDRLAERVFDTGFLASEIADELTASFASAQRESDQA